MEFKVEDYVEEGLILLAKLISFKTVLHQYDPKAEAPFGSLFLKLLVMKDLPLIMIGIMLGTLNLEREKKR